MIVQYIIIIAAVCIGLYLRLDNLFDLNERFMTWIFVPSLLILAGMCYCLYKHLDDHTDNPCWYIYHVLYVGYIIGYSFLLSHYTKKYISLRLLFIHFLDLMASLIYLLLFKSDNLFGLFFVPFLMSILVVVLFHFFWTNNDTIYISIFALLNLIYLTVFADFSKKKCYDDEYNFAVIIFNYAIFCIIFAVTIGLILLGLYLALLVLQCVCFCFANSE